MFRKRSPKNPVHRIQIATGAFTGNITGPGTAFTKSLFSFENLLGTAGLQQAAKHIMLHGLTIYTDGTPQETVTSADFYMQVNEAWYVDTTNNAAIDPHPSAWTFQNMWAAGANAQLVPDKILMTRMTYIEPVTGATLSQSMNWGPYRVRTKRRILPSETLVWQMDFLNQTAGVNAMVFTTYAIAHISVEL